jgi:hypothetical protein
MMEGKMHKRKGQRAFIFVIIFSIAVIFTALASGTLAAFSATYTWMSSEGVIGTFDFLDDTLEIDLFGEQPIYPGDAGFSALSGTDFADYSVDWSFSQTAGGDVPMLFYVDDGAALWGFYSPFEYAAEFPTLFIKLSADEYISCAQVSDASEDLASEFSIGFDVCWIWPDKLYDYDGANYVEASGAAYDEFIQNNENICKSNYSYSFDCPNIVAAVQSDTHKFDYAICGGDQTLFDITFIDRAEVEYCGGLLMCGSEHIPIYCAASEAFIVPDAEYEVSQNDYYAFYSCALQPSMLAVINSLFSSGINYDILGNTKGGTDYTAYFWNYGTPKTEISTIDNGEHARAVCHIKPAAVCQRSFISVTITAEVTI